MLAGIVNINSKIKNIIILIRGLLYNGLILIIINIKIIT